jgi:cell division transport system permease protein
LAEKLKKVQGIDTVKYGKDTINTLLKVNNILQIGSLVIIGLLSIIAVFIISNTVKLTVMSRRREISIMKLIGATDTFIRLPFVIEGIGIGFFSSIVTFLICKFGYQYCYDNMKNMFAFMKLVSFDNIQIFLFTSFLAIGVLIGGLGSYISVKKYLSI